MEKYDVVDVCCSMRVASNSLSIKGIWAENVSSQGKESFNHEAKLNQIFRKATTVLLCIVYRFIETAGQTSTQHIFSTAECTLQIFFCLIPFLKKCNPNH